MLLNSVVQASQLLVSAFPQAGDFIYLLDVGLVNELRVTIARLEGFDGFNVLLPRTRQTFNDGLC